jgi:hypothetical protein
MTPQSPFMVVAPIAGDKEADLRATLDLMNIRPGVVDPNNQLLPFAGLERLHFARLVILEDRTAGDLKAYDLTPRYWPKTLAFLGDCDGPTEDFLRELVAVTQNGLQKIFSHCRGFEQGADLLQWLKAHSKSPAANYVNWIGRTVRQVREECALRDTLIAFIERHSAELRALDPRQVFYRLQDVVRAETEAGRLTLSAPEPTPLSWRAGNFLHLVGVPLVLLLLAPLLLMYLPIFAYQLRRREKSDPEITPRPAADHVRKLASLEDHDVTNQFSAVGAVKPGLFRRWTVTFFIWVLNYGTRHIFNHGYLTRVKTIHFARWVFLDKKHLLFFASNYDGSLESYMDDFINKVAWGLNLVFSNGVGYPRARWLILDGAKDEQKFKNFIRRHELPTEVWYNAHPGLTAFDLERNTKIREGIERAAMSDDEIRAWLRLL